MRNASFALKKQISQNTKYEVEGVLNGNGVTKTLTGDDFVANSITFTHSTSANGKFEIGGAIIGKVDFQLNNYDGRFDDLDLTNTRVDMAVVVVLPDGKREKIRQGIYWLESPQSHGAVIACEGFDALSRLERPYGKDYVDTSSAYTLADEVCRNSGLSFKVTSGHADVSFPEANTKDLTCLQILAYLAQISTHYVYADDEARICFGWYDLQAFEQEDNVDGGVYDTINKKHYQSGESKDGGDFLFRESADSADGGVFDKQNYHVINVTNSLSVYVDDVVITGVEVQEQPPRANSNGESPKANPPIFVGEKGYVLELKNNPFITYNDGQRIAENIYALVGGMRFRPFSASCLSNPCIQAGDAVVLVDRKHATYRSFANHVVFKIGSYQTVVCHAQTPERKSAASFSAVTEAIVAQRNELKEERNARNLALQHLQREIEHSSGLYFTEEQTPSGAAIYYMHDKPTKRESKIIWKITSEGIAVSNNGGRTYSIGLAADGTAILNKIYAVGLNADYITTGKLTVKDNSKKIFEADVSKGKLFIDGSSLIISLNEYYKNSRMSFDYDGFVFSYTRNKVDYKISFGRDGMWFRTSSGKSILTMGMNSLEGHPDLIGSSIALGWDGWYMGFSSYDTSRDVNPTLKLSYWNAATETLRSRNLDYIGRVWNFDCDVNMRGHKLINTHGVTATISGAMLQDIKSSSNWRYVNYNLRFEGGILVGAS